MESQAFIGNSVSSFSAVLLLERQFSNKWSSYYNSGDIPMSSFLDFYKLPWVVYSNCESIETSDMQLLESAARMGSWNIYLYCIGNVDQPFIEKTQQLEIVLVSNNNLNLTIDSLENHITDILPLFSLLVQNELSQFNYVAFSSLSALTKTRFTLGDFDRPLPEDFALYTLQSSNSTSIILVNSLFIRQRFIDIGMSFFYDQNSTTRQSLQDRMQDTKYIMV
eukprot:TRINITY_DN2291_c0_g1_i11.p3 TRINITY_DN2291_c0_g1~~TRINITY_DN2291_c0_g1_i11.p3  ORF type:complete len:222 (-),score=9.13 TRINITY_DN2291_c0_g1_i11:618-1283(-)